MQCAFTKSNLLFRRLDCEMPTKYDRYQRFRRNRRADREAGEGKTSGRSLNTRREGRRNKTRKLETSTSLSLLFFLPLFFRPSPPFPFLLRRLSLRTSHPIQFSSFHLYMDFLASRGPFFLSFVERLAQTCCTSPPHFFPLSISPSFSFLVFLSSS